MLGAIDQIGHVTGDLDVAVAMWTARLGVGPWTVFRNVKLTGDYLGAPADVTINVALAYRGGVQIELIEPTSNAPSPYRDGAGALREGVHHLGWVVDDLDAAIEDFARLDAAIEDFARRGLTPMFRARNAASEVACFEPAPGVTWELIAGAGMRSMIDAGIAAAAGRDGSAPVTEIDLARG